MQNGRKHSARLAVMFASIAVATLALTPFATSAPKTPKTVAPMGDGEGIPVEGGDAGLDAGQDAASPQPRPKPPKFGPPAPVTLTAYLAEGAPSMTSEVTWRLYEGSPAPDGSYKLLQTIREARPTIQLKPGEYLINASYGRANLTKKIGVWPEKPASEDFIVNAGGLRLSATLAKGPIVAENLQKFEIFSESQDQFGNRQKILGEIRPGIVVRLNSGLYHIVSTYGDGNSVISTDAVIEPGKITEAIIDHDAGKVTLKLVQRNGGEAVADTRWTIYNSAGETVKESAGAFPTHILAAGDYRVSALHGDNEYIGNFSIAAGDTKQVEVIMK